MKWKVYTWIDVLKHIAVIIALGLSFLLFFFYIYLPATTNHGESVTVPDLNGISLDDLQEFLVDRDLRYEVVDSVYSADLPPLTVTRQFPKPGSRVKENRKIYISLNSFNPPTTLMPDLLDKTVQNARLLLKSKELAVGHITTKPDAFRNVLEQLYKGESIEANTKIPKGSVIDLVIGDGHGISTFEMPDLRGLPLKEAKVIIRGNNLSVGLIFRPDSLKNQPLVVIRQSPDRKRIVRVGRTVDIWMGLESEVKKNEDEEN